MFQAMIPFPFSLLATRQVYRMDKGEAEKWIVDAQSLEMDMLKIAYDRLPEGSASLSKEELAKAIRLAEQDMYRTTIHIGRSAELVDA